MSGYGQPILYQPPPSGGSGTMIAVVVVIVLIIIVIAVVVGLYMGGVIGGSDVEQLAIEAERLHKLAVEASAKAVIQKNQAEAEIHANEAKISAKEANVAADKAKSLAPADNAFVIRAVRAANSANSAAARADAYVKSFVGSTPLPPASQPPASSNARSLPANCDAKSCNATMYDWVVNRYWAFDGNLSQCANCPRRGFKAAHQGIKAENPTWIDCKSRVGCYNYLKLPTSEYFNPENMMDWY